MEAAVLLVIASGLRVKLLTRRMRSAETPMDADLNTQVMFLPDLRDQRQGAADYEPVVDLAHETGTALGATAGLDAADGARQVIFFMRQPSEL